MSDDITRCSGEGCPRRDACHRFRAVAHGRFDAFGSPPWDETRATCDAFYPLRVVDDEAIRLRAYHLWVRAGRRDGTADADWRSARAELEVERDGSLHDSGPNEHGR